MNDLISIIIPAYNTRERIISALESVTAQTYHDIEIIIIDDASDDGTAGTARDYLTSQSRPYRIITHDHNRGVSAARNTGLAAAQGKYIAFMDSDDVLQPEYAAKLHGIIAANECDISCCGLLDRFTDGRPDKDMLHSPGNSDVYSGESLLLMNKVPAFVCCLYRKKFIDEYGLCFHEGCSSGEDTEFQAEAFCRAERVIFIDECLYIYIHHENMGSVRDNDTSMKKAIRYEHNTYAQKRTAEYIIEHAKSEELRETAGKILLPQSVIRMFTLYAVKHDRAGYDELLHDVNLMNVLKGTQNINVLMKKPELFFKALAIIHAPNIYYRFRGR